MTAQRLGQSLMALGLGVGLVTAAAMGAHLGLVDVPWLVNVALAKLGFVAAGGLMAAGAGTIRFAKRREEWPLTAARLVIEHDLIVRANIDAVVGRIEPRI